MDIIAAPTAEIKRRGVDSLTALARGGGGEGGGGPPPKTLTMIWQGRVLVREREKFVKSTLSDLSCWEQHNYSNVVGSAGNIAKV